MDLTVANKGGGNNDNNNNSNENMLRDYRKGNWNLQETMVLIEAKKMDDERRMKRLGEINERGKPAELRWKWVEDYCWKNGCLRSQNQCNDKWDNLMRDFKKVRDYQKKRMVGDDGDDDKSNYWRIDKNERKDNNLPSNMLPQIYEALVEVVERKGQASSGGAAGCSSVVSLPAVAVVGKTNSRVLGHHQHTFLPSSPPVMQQYSNTVQAPASLVAPPPADQTPTDTPRRGAVPDCSPPLPTVDSDTSEYSGSPAKRRKRRGGGGEGTSGAGRTIQELGSAISTSASAIAEAIHSCEEREERRHREVMSVHERRLQIEESKAEMNRQGINGLVDAIHKLADSIFALAANK